MDPNKDVKTRQSYIETGTENFQNFLMAGAELETRLSELEHELSDLKVVYKAREQILHSLLNRVAQCEAMAGIQPQTSSNNNLNDDSPAGTGSLSVVD